MADSLIVHVVLLCARGFLVLVNTTIEVDVAHAG